MSEKRVVVWVQHFGDRPYLMLQWHDPVTGKRKSKSAETNNPVDAELKRSDLEYELNHGLHQEPARMTWARFRELFEAEYVAALRPDTRDNYADTLNAFEKLCAPTSLRAVTERTLSSFAYQLRKQKGKGGGTVQESTVKVRLQFLRTALNWAVRQKLLPECPAFPAVKPPEKKPQPVPVESYERVLAKAPDANMRAFLQAGWLAGLRLNEAIALRWEDTDRAPWVDLAGERIVFPGGFVKGREDQWVPLDPELRQELLALPRTDPRVFRFDAIDGRGERQLTDISISAKVRDLAAAAGVRLTFKSLRRGFGCRYAGKVPAQVLQKLMRHSTISLTMTYYANVDDAAMQAVLGGRRNTSRNSEPQETDRAESIQGGSCGEEQACG